MSGETHDKSNPFSGPLSQAMWAKANRVTSAYEDGFDYGIYDQLYDRFRGKLPRGGVVYKGALKLIEAASCARCFYRFEIDTYGRGCIHDCSYCYAKNYLTVKKYWNEPIPFPIDIAEIRKIFATVFETSKYSKFRHILEQRIPLRIGAMSDAFMWMDKKYRVTLELLKILRFYHYPYIIFTRSDLVADDEYMQVMAPKLASIQMSISSLNESLTRKIEPGAPTPKRRLEALRKLAAHRFWTAVRINPLFPIYPDGYYTNPDFDHSRSINPFHFFSWDMIEAIAQHNVPTVIVGMGRLYRPILKFLNQALGYDMMSHFAEDMKSKSMVLYFSTEETAFYYQKIKALCDMHGLRFSTCYIGNDETGESFDNYKYLWTNRDDCCDSIGNVKAFQTTCETLQLVALT